MFYPRHAESLAHEYQKEMRKIGLCLAADCHIEEALKAIDDCLSDKRYSKNKEKAAKQFLKELWDNSYLQFASELDVPDDFFCSDKEIFSFPLFNDAIGLTVNYFEKLFKAMF